MSTYTQYKLSEILNNSYKIILLFLVRKCLKYKQKNLIRFNKSSDLKNPANTLLMNQSAASHLSDVLAHIFDDHFIRRDGLHGKQAPVVDVRLAESDLLLSELGTENGEESVRKVHPLLCLSRSCSCSLLFFSNVYKKRPLEPKSCWFVYLQLVELQQVTVAGKRGQQTSLL